MQVWIKWDILDEYLARIPPEYVSVHHIDNADKNERFEFEDLVPPNPMESAHVACILQNVITDEGFVYRNRFYVPLEAISLSETVY